MMITVLKRVSYNIDGQMAMGTSVLAAAETIHVQQTLGLTHNGAQINLSGRTNVKLFGATVTGTL